MKRVELLSPAGDFDCLKAAVNNGANAVYLGGTNFSARASAKNFDLDEIKEAVKYAHLRNVKIYVAINTLLDDDEIDQAYELVKKYYEYNVDALIIQDLGLFYRIKKDFPDFELHASTQMHIHNLQGVKNAKELGFSRVIVARESSLDSIKEFCKEDIEIECFVHGALCVSYSGQCLLSSFTKDRSANRGECAQCCRLKYFYKDNNKTYKTNTDYLLSPKDMMLLKDISDLIEAGVTSFKIEGRLKSASYVGFVTRLYRQAIDSYYAGNKYHVSNNDMDNLKVLFNRGYSNAYLNSNNINLFNNKRPNNMGIEVGNVVSSKDGYIQIKLKKQLKLHDAIRIINDQNEYGTEIFELYINKNKIDVGNPGEIVSIRSSKSFNSGDTVLKTADLSLEKEITNCPDIKRNISIKMTCKPKVPISIECKIGDYSFGYFNEYKPELPINSPISIDTITKQLSKTDTHPYKLFELDIEYTECFIPIKQLNEIRRDFYNKLDDYLLSQFHRENKSSVYQLKDFEIFNDNTNIIIENNRYNDYTLNPVINNSSIYNSDNNIVSEFGGLLLKRNKIAYYTLNVYNSYSYEFLLKLGFEKIIISVELDDDHILKLINSFYSRNNIKIVPYVVKNGYINLMNIYKNPFDDKLAQITDGKNTLLINRFDEYTALSMPIESLKPNRNSSLYNPVIIK